MYTPTKSDTPPAPVEIALYPDFAQPLTDPDALRRVFAASERAGREHKFLVLLPLTGGGLVVAVGPPLAPEGAYLHRQIHAATEQAYPGYPVAGGGFLALTPADADDGLPVARFHSRSGDYGRYGTRLLAAPVQRGLEKILLRRVMFG